MERRFYAEPINTRRGFWMVFDIDDDLIVYRVIAEDAASAIRKAKARLKRVANRL